MNLRCTQKQPLALSYNVLQAIQDLMQRAPTSHNSTTRSVVQQQPQAYPDEPQAIQANDTTESAKHGNADGPLLSRGQAAAAAAASGNRLKASATCTKPKCPKQVVEAAKDLLQTQSIYEQLKQ